ncbi:YtzI protein [Bacillus sp. AFS053548]|nr:YtzI protein [Bacillus sp. AFS053548]PGM59431.1 YtzI protein [Bacillus sp. AFS053548]
MTGVFVVSGIIIVVVFGAFVLTVNKGYGVQHKVDKLEDVKMKNNNDEK